MDPGRCPRSKIAGSDLRTRTYREAMSERPAPTTVGELRATGHVARSVRAEIRDNLLAALAAGDDP